MKQIANIIFLMLIPLLAFFAQWSSKKSIVFDTNSGAVGEKLEIQFKKGNTFKDPTFDYNNHWTKESFPGEFDYSYSAQPALVYAAEIDTKIKINEYLFKLIGHSHYSDRDGKLYSDVSTITTAKNIVQEAKVILN